MEVAGGVGQGDPSVHDMITTVKGSRGMWRVDAGERSDGKKETARLGGLGARGCGSTRPAEDGEPADNERVGLAGIEDWISRRQAQGRPSADGGVTGMCSVGQGEVFSSWADVFSFRPNVFTLVGHVFS